jgi:hypothetical protein
MEVTNRGHQIAFLIEATTIMKTRTGTSTAFIQTSALQKKRLEMDNVTAMTAAMNMMLQPAPVHFCIIHLIGPGWKASWLLY